MQQTGRRKGVSLREIANAVGVTEGTASRALNGYPDIAQATRLKVAEAARVLNYRPSPSARRLACGTVETVGYVLPAHSAGQTDPFLSEMLDGISQALAVRDWDLLVTTVATPEHELDVYERLVDSGKVSGLIVTRTRSEDRRVDFLKSAGLPFVVHGRTRDATGYAWLDIDNEKAFADAVGHLAALGHRRIALISASPEFNFSRLRIDGYTNGLAQSGLPAPAGYIVEADLSAEGGRQAMAALLAHKQRPTAVICVSDSVAIGAMQAIRSHGLKVGHDISVIGYDGLPFGAYSDPPLTTMTQDVNRTGRRLAEMLLAILDGAAAEEFQEIWHVRLVRRVSDSSPR